MKAIILNLIAWGTLPIMDGMAKYLSTQMHFVEVVWARYFFMVVLSLPIIFFFFRRYQMAYKIFYFKCLEVFFYFYQLFCFFYAISVISLAKAFTLAFVAPIIVTILSALLLKEKVGFESMGCSICWIYWSTYYHSTRYY